MSNEISPKRQYLMDKYPSILTLIERFECDIISDDIRASKIANRVDYWFDQFAYPDDIKKIEEKASQ